MFGVFRIIGAADTISRSRVLLNGVHPGSLRQLFPFRLPALPRTSNIRNTSMDVRTFVTELRRRHVYRVAVAYCVVGWVLIQIATQVFPFLEIPNWAIRLVIMLLVIGFPIALIIAWAFELTPDGFKRTESADAARQHSRGGVWIAVVLIAAVLSLGLFFVGRYTTSHPGVDGRAALASLPEKSIAVLPFENLSEDKSNAYFATGIQDEILTRLAKISELKVISRTSTAQYQSKPGNVSEVAKQLGVAHVLEGSVQKAGDAVRVNVQLINAQKDSHVWAETYDRKLIDIFAVETEIARSIAEQLQTKLAGHEQQALAIKPTDNATAYDAYLRGLAAETESLISVYPLQKAISFYKRAVQLDPNFALAWARLSRMYSWLYSSFGDRTGNAKGALERAQALQPDAPETLLALAYYQNDELGDYEAARQSFVRVAPMLPGKSEIPAALASIARRQGRWDEAVSYFEHALVLDPRNPELLVHAAFNYGDQRQFETALQFLDRALEIRPGDLEIRAEKAAIYQAKGDLAEANKYLGDITALTPSYEAVGAKLTQLRLERKYDEAIRLLKTRLAEFEFGSEVEQAVFGYYFLVAQHLAGDDAGVQATGAQTRDRLVQLTREQPDNDWLAIILSQTYAILGDKSNAWKEAERVKTITPVSRDAAVGPFGDENMAVVATLFGEKSRAIELLARLVRIPYSGWLYGNPVTPALLRLDPVWGPLRSDPTFQKLCQEKPH
jgi:TolB-like protein/predicted Zn-dependent protease